MYVVTKVMVNGDYYRRYMDADQVVESVKEWLKNENSGVINIHEVDGIADATELSA